MGSRAELDILDQAHRLFASGNQRGAVDLVVRAAESGDPLAQHAVANWRLYGLNGPRDVPEAHRLLDRAIASGSVDATHLKANLVANGTGVSPDGDAALRLLEAIARDDPFAANQVHLLRAPSVLPPREQLLDDPDVWVSRGIFSREESDYLISRAQPELHPSFVVDPRTGGRMPHPARTSFGMNFDPIGEDPVVRMLNIRIAKVTGTTVDCGEPLHVLRYAPGQEYRPHLDAVPDATNQRCWTVLTYLNDAYQGGETEFDLLRIRFRGEPGDALIFRNAGADGVPDQRLRHAGLPVDAGMKWLATRWIRAAPHDPWALSY